MKSNWRKQAGKQLLINGCAGLADDLTSLNDINAAADKIKASSANLEANVQKRKRDEAVIADLLDLSPEELFACSFKCCCHSHLCCDWLDPCFA